MATTFGLTVDGFSLKRLEDIKAELEVSLRTTFGNGINLLPTELLGQIVGIVSEREALLWELGQAVYNSQYPDSANGVSLDNVVAITAIKRLEATKGTGQGIAYGTLGTVIPAGSIISVSGNPSARFVTLTDNTIAAGTDEIQLIQFSSVPDAGNWTLVFNGVETGTLVFNDNAAAVETALNALSNLSGVTVTGDYTAGFTITFSGSDGQQDQALLQSGTNTLTTSSIQVNLNFTETTQGVLPNVTCDVEAETAGEIPAYAGTLTVIETTISGWDSFNNPLDITTGKNVETDAELRLRRNKTLATAGAATVDAIRSRILEIDEVTDARVFENDTDVTDIYNRPPHSFEAVVQDGDDQEIADTIWDVKGAGIATYGDTTMQVTDTMGFVHDVSFSRPTPIPIYVIVNVVTDPALFPLNGDQAIKDAIVNYADENFGIGDDVITVELFCPIVDVEGILDIDILIGIVDPPVSDANVAIADDEIAFFDTSQITVNVT